jgi:iron complex outermembrane receptor protein
MNSRLKWFLGACVLAGVVVGASAASAAPDSNNQISEVVVTAERRETSVQKVPATVAVVSNALLSAANVTDVENLQILVPGLVSSHLAGTDERPYVRGIGNDLYGIASNPSVATYVDGVYLPQSDQTFDTFNDVDRVEVLKGPQAVLYGRNATGGALVIYTKQPQFKPEITGDLSYGNYNDVQGHLGVTGPIIGDTLAGRLAIGFKDRDAFGINLPSRTGQDPWRSIDVHGALLAHLANNLTATLSVDYSNTKSGDYVKTLNPNAWDYLLTTGQYTPKPFERYGNINSSDPLTDGGLKLNVNWDTPYGVMTSITSYRLFDEGPIFYDNDGVGQPLTFPTNPPIVLGQLYNAGSTEQSRQYSQETYFTTPADKPLRMIVGGNVSYEETVNAERTDFFAFQDSNDNLKDTAFALYGDFNYDPISNLTLTAGVRYSGESKTYSYQSLNTDANGNILSANPTVVGHGYWAQFTPRFGIQYKPTDGVLLYANVTNGFKSGGFNQHDPSDKFLPEQIWSYEGGLKARWSSQLTTNVSVYYYDYRNLQVQQVILPQGTTVVANAAGATLYGLDADITYRPIDGLQLGANLALEHSEYGSLYVLDDLVSPSVNVNVKGNTLKRAPNATALLYADYKFDIGPGALSTHLEGSYRSRTYYTFFQDLPNSQAEFWLLNANIKYAFDNGRQYISIYGQNLTNTVYATSVEDVACCIGPVNGSPLYAHFGEPRTYGIRYGFKY